MAITIYQCMICEKELYSFEKLEYHRQLGHSFFTIVHNEATRVTLIDTSKAGEAQMRILKLFAILLGIFTGTYIFFLLFIYYAVTSFAMYMTHLK